MSKNETLKVMIYDDSTLDDGWDGLKEDGLALSWKWGDKLYRKFGSIDIAFGAKSFEEAFGYISNLDPEKKVSEVHFWCHGGPGKVYLNRKFLNIDNIGPSGFHAVGLRKLKARLTDDALVWFRCCSLFAGQEGHDFAKKFAHVLNKDGTSRRVAAYTHIIGPSQSGLHTLGPGEEPSWSLTEGLDENGKMKWSRFWKKNTVSCLRGTIPKGW